jgi:hypothetical protein
VASLTLPKVPSPMVLPEWDKIYRASNSRFSYPCWGPDSRAGGSRLQSLFIVVCCLIFIIILFHPVSLTGILSKKFYKQKKVKLKINVDQLTSSWKHSKISSPCSFSYSRILSSVS